MSSTSASRVEEVNELTSLVRGLKNRDLQLICATNKLSKSGNKADLLRRIINLIEVKASDKRHFEAIQNSVWKVTNPELVVARQQAGLLSSSSVPPSNQSSSYAASSMSPASGYTNGQSYGEANGQRSQPSGLKFKPSPFYDIETLIGDVQPCEAMAAHRNTVSFYVKASSVPALQRCANDPTMRVLAFCAAGNVGLQDIAFPTQVELKVNGEEVKANMRGVKNKPGSTRPVDITNFLRLKPPGYTNKLEFTYALTSKGGDQVLRATSQKFYLALYVCKTYSVDDLVGKIERKNRITKASVIHEIAGKASDPDIEATAEVLSLKCPLTYMRLSLPVRSMLCKHIQCFDATSYLQLQEQGPQWLCPICNKPASFENLAVDEYVKDILRQTGSQDQVTIEPNGDWHVADTEEAVSKPDNHDASYVEDDDDLIISDVSYLGGRNTSTPNRPAGRSMATPSGGTPGEGSSMRQASSSNKRSIAEVIDLTLSDDDEPPDPPPKRQQLSVSQGFNGLVGR